MTPFKTTILTLWLYSLKMLTAIFLLIWHKRLLSCLLCSLLVIVVPAVKGAK
jgi:hypothetical protein